MNKLGLAIALTALAATIVSAFAQGTQTPQLGDRGHLVVVPVGSFPFQDPSGIAVDRRSLEVIRIRASEVYTSAGVDNGADGDSNVMALGKLDFSLACQGYCDGKGADCVRRCTECTGSIRTTGTAQLFTTPLAATEADQVLCIEFRAYVSDKGTNTVEEINTRVRLEMNDHPLRVERVTVIRSAHSRVLGQAAQLSRPGGLAIDSRNGTLIIADTGNCAVKRANLGPAIAPLDTVVGGQCPNDQLRGPLGVAALGEELLVLDEGIGGGSVIKSVRDGSIHIVAENLPSAESIHGVFYSRPGLGFDQWTIYTAGSGGVSELFIDPLYSRVPQRSHLYISSGQGSHPTSITTDGNGLVYFIDGQRIVRSLPGVSSTPSQARCTYETSYQTVVSAHAQPGRRLVEAPPNFAPVAFAIVDGYIANPDAHRCASLTKMFDTTGVVLNWNSQTGLYELLLLSDPGAMEGNI